jgi:energy-coupling factor transporter ATP-binding protein EcfA2
LFLDEPTSGLDSQTSWSILNLLEKLTNAGQAILCTIHQPSAILFQRFDRLLFLAAGGKTVYFGPVGRDSNILIDYFERNGALECPPGANPAEYMLEAIGAAPGSHSDIDWHQVWRSSPEYQEVQMELEQMKDERSLIRVASTHEGEFTQFAAPFGVQFLETQKRIFQQYWRTPEYIYSKMLLCAATVSICLVWSCEVTLTLSLGSLHWVFTLQGTKYPAGLAESALRYFHAFGPVLPTCSTDHASFRHSTKSVRGT